MAKAVAKKEEADLPAKLMLDMEADAAEHQQEFGRDQLIIPRITILQDLSPQTKERKTEYVEGARPGLIFNNISNALDEEILFVPSKFFVRYIAWKPNRGGLVDQTLTKDEVEANFEDAGIGMWTGAMKNNAGELVQVEVVETPEWVGIARGHDGVPMPVAISFPVTKAKSARKINTAIDLTERPGKGGKPFRPPVFYHKFQLKTAIETSGENEWFGWAIQHLGLASTEDDLDMMVRAKDLKIAFDKGEAEVSEEGASQS